MSYGGKLCINSVDIANFNPKKLKFLILNKFTEDPKYKKVWTMIKNKYIPLLKEDGIDIVYTDDIDDWAFTFRKLIPNFNTTQERDIYLNSLNELIDEDYEEPVCSTTVTPPLSDLDDVPDLPF